MYISLINDQVPPSYAIRRQAAFWKTHFDTSGLGTELDFDTYGSGGNANFETSESGTEADLDLDFVAAAEALKNEGNTAKIFLKLAVF